MVAARGSRSQSVALRTAEHHGLLLGGSCATLAYHCYLGAALARPGYPLHPLTPGYRAAAQSKDEADCYRALS